MKRSLSVWFLFLIGFAGNILAQYDPSSVARVEDGTLIYRLDLRWTDAQKKEISAIFDLDSTLWLQVASGKKEVLLDSALWKVESISDHIVEISKLLETNPVFHLNEFDIFLVEDSWKTPPGYVDQDKVVYGFNSFSKPNIFRYGKGMARLFLPGNEKYYEVYIAGSFNNWDPRKTAMQRADSGWVVQLPLPPGKYYYKYVLDGRWITDPNNRFSENDGQGNINSVFYCPNYQFKLNGHTQARRVSVAGSFNNWNRNEIRMHRTRSGWILPLYLKDGTYTYKFLVDDSWMNDPENSSTRTDHNGNVNSLISKGDEHTFTLSGFQESKKVVLTGSFNNWNTDELLMEKVPGGWRTSYALSPGNYEYKFIADGNWITDPANPYTSGTGNRINSTLAVNPNYTFTLPGFENAGEVIIAGTFNGWNPDGYKMVNKNGIWTFPLYLEKGKHLYKYIVDGKWIIDPENKNWEQNEHGTGNSVLWVR